MTFSLAYYLLAVLTLSFMPGPDMLYIISQSLAHGRRFGLAAALGIAAGCFVHIFAVTIGLSSLIFESSLAFTLIKYLGAAYLVYLGISSLWQRQSILINRAAANNNTSWKKAFLQGFFTNVLNPKVALFFLAFLPQFVTPTSSHSMALQMLVLGLMFNAIGSSVNISVALCFGSIKQWLNHHPKSLLIQQKLTGLILLGLGLRLAIFER